METVKNQWGIQWNSLMEKLQPGNGNHLEVISLQVVRTASCAGRRFKLPDGYLPIRPGIHNPIAKKATFESCYSSLPGVKTPGIEL